MSSSTTGRALSLPDWMPAWLLWGALLCGAVILFAAAQYSINAVNGWWADELFALWASDTSVSFATAYSERIARDTNPPLYFSILYWVRSIVVNDRAAVLILNTACTAAGSAAVLLLSRPSRLTGLATAGIAAFLLSGPLMRYASEGRAYLPALVVAFVASWCVALAVQAPRDRPPPWAFVAVGAVAALVHVYAALFCGVLAAGLLLLVLLDRSRRDLVGPALALGVSTSIVFGLWLATIVDSFGRIDWIEFSTREVLNAAWFVKELTVGYRLAGMLLLVLLLFGLLRGSTRPVTLVFAATFALFIALPLLVSLKKPIILGRYWVIGAPGLIVLVAFLARAWWTETGANRLASWLLLGVALLACVTSLSGFLAARTMISAKPVWKGADIVRPLVENCPDRSIHVGSAGIVNSRASLPYFARMADMREGLFADAGSSATPNLAAATARCPVMGWAEHVLRGDDFLARAPDAELLRLLRISARPQDVEIRRHPSGFVVLKRSPAQ